MATPFDLLQQLPRLIQRDPTTVAARYTYARASEGGRLAAFRFRAHHVVHKSEVARLFPIAENSGRLRASRMAFINIDSTPE